MSHKYTYKLLLVEDDYDVAEMLELYFSAQGFDVHHAGTGAEGVEAARQWFPNLILLDVMLPDMDGYDTCLTLRQKSLTRYIPIIFLTQKDERAAKVRGLELGADDYITKPFDIDELRLRVRGSIERATRENLHESRTGLPTGPLIDQEIQRRDGSPYTEIILRVDGFTEFRDVYSFMAASEVLYHAGKKILSAVAQQGTPDDFVGTLDDGFIVLTNAKDPSALETMMKDTFAESVKAFYSFKDSARGGILVNVGTEREKLVPFMSLSTVLRVGAG